MRSEKDPIRPALIDTIKCYLNITDRDLVNQYLGQAIKNYQVNCDLHVEALKKTAVDENSQSEKQAKVKFDFDKLPSTEKSSKAKKKENSSSGNPLKQNGLDQFLFAKYSFLDLVVVLTRFANETMVRTVYELAMTGIEVNIILFLV
jgi:hypothetical protein